MLTVSVPVWVISWGTCSTVTAAPTATEARTWGQEWLREQRAAVGVAGRWGRLKVRAATQADVDALAESGLLPSWLAAATEVAPPVSPDQQTLEV